jgi:hypothetical protein
MSFFTFVSPDDGKNEEPIPHRKRTPKPPKWPVDVPTAKHRLRSIAVTDGRAIRRVFLATPARKGARRRGAAARRGACGCLASGSERAWRAGVPGGRRRAPAQGRAWLAVEAGLCPTDAVAHHKRKTGRWGAEANDHRFAAQGSPGGPVHCRSSSDSTVRPLNSAHQHQGIKGQSGHWSGRPSRASEGPWTTRSGRTAASEADVHDPRFASSRSSISSSQPSSLTAGTDADVLASAWGRMSFRGWEQPDALRRVNNIAARAPALRL